MYTSWACNTSSLINFIVDYSKKCAQRRHTVLSNGETSLACEDVLHEMASEAALEAALKTALKAALEAALAVPWNIQEGQVYHGSHALVLHNVRRPKVQAGQDHPAATAQPAGQQGRL